MKAREGAIFFLEGLRERQPIQWPMSADGIETVQSFIEAGGRCLKILPWAGVIFITPSIYFLDFLPPNSEFFDAAF